MNSCSLNLQNIRDVMKMKQLVPNIHLIIIKCYHYNETIHNLLFDYQYTQINLRKFLCYIIQYDSAKSLQWLI